jgi:hypothetical protein
MSARCRECHASIPDPAPNALTMRCPYCGLEQQAPDADARHRRMLEEQREARLRAEAEANAEAERRRQDREDRQEEREEREKRRERRWRPVTWLLSLIPLLIATVIIAITVFDAPARLGFGASGKDRLEQIQQQLTGTGCTTLQAPEAEYASSNVSKLVGVAEQQCIRVFAAGGGGHNSLGLKLFDPEGKELAHAAQTPGATSMDPQVQYCSPRGGTLRYQIEVGVVAKGRLSHMVLACPAPKRK